MKILLTIFIIIVIINFIATIIEIKRSKEIDSKEPFLNDDLDIK